MTTCTAWRRVSRSKPCAICERSDWCGVSADGSVAICMRITSDKPTQNGGWLHRLTEDTRDYRRPVRTVRLAPKRTPRGDLIQLADRSRAAVDFEQLDRFAGGLGVSVNSFRRLGIGWAQRDRAFSFPMVDHYGRIRGIRLRGVDGSKWAVRGGRDGLFLPLGDPTEDRLLICEGVSDCAALLDLRFGNVVGRPSCSGGTRLIVELVGVRKPREAVIVADGDEPGLRGASALASVLIAHVPVRVVQPPVGTKDIRAWLQAGAERADVGRLIEIADVQRLRVKIAS